jgi:hypothetical protein
MRKEMRMNVIRFAKKAFDEDDFDEAVKSK